jgi:hypothetical protein
MEGSDRQAGAHEGQHAPFDEEYATDPHEAVEILFGRALPELPPITEERVRWLYEPFEKTWGSKKLVTGSISYVRGAVLSNAGRLRNLPTFGGFKVELYPSQECAQLTAFFARTFEGMRVWSTADALFACGDSQFGAEEEGRIGSEGHTIGEVVDMLHQVYREHPDGVERGTPASDQLQAIGRAIDETGGKQLMLSVHEQFKIHDTWHARNLELMWDGIGEWRG